jgi:excisionase family DNA binding protein
MTILECAELLQIDKLTLYKHARKGSFPVFHVAGNVRVNPAELAEHIRTGSNSQLIQADRR